MKFKDKQSGCVYEFLQEHDIADMLRHPDYEVVEEPVVVKEEKPVKQTKKAE